MRAIFPALGLACLAILAASAAAEEENARLAPRSEQSAFFGGEEIELAYRVVSDQPRGTLRWRYAAGERTLARGEIAVEPDGKVALALRLPPVREGVVFPTELTVELYDRRENVVARHRRTLWLFSRDPFVARRRWLEELNITLYDPQGDTARVFDDAEIPYRAARNTDALKALESGLVIVGEGVSFQTRRGLTEAMADLARRGVRVLCLAPAEGEFPLPQRGEPSRLLGLTFRGAEVIRELDKRLDACCWSGDGPVARTGLMIAARRGQVILQVAEPPRAWPWWRGRYAGGGEWIVCGFGLIDHWDAGPTPRFLLARILEQLAEKRRVESEERRAKRR